MAQALVFISVCFWGWSFVATKILLEYLSPAEIIAARMFLGIPVLAVLYSFKRGSLRFNRREWGLLLTTAVVLTLHFAIQVSGLQFTSATNTGWIIAVTPLSLALLSFLFLGETLNKWQGAGLCVATSGILLLVSNGNLADLTWLSSKGDWLILASSGTWAVYTVLIKKLSRRHGSLAISLVLLSLVGLVMAVYIALTSGFSVFFGLPGRAMAAMIFLGVGCLALAFWFWQEGVARLGAAKAGFFLYLEPLATTLLAVPLLAEPFGPLTALGGVFVLAGVFLAERRKPIPVASQHASCVN